MYDTNDRTDAPERGGAGDFVNFFVQYCLHHFFKSKKEMSNELGIGYQSVLLLTNTPEKYKGASLVFQELVVYCIRKGVSMDEIAQAFYHRNSMNSMRPKTLKQISSYYTHCPITAEYDQLFASEPRDSLLSSVYQFISYMHALYCENCMYFWNSANRETCFVQQTTEFLVNEFRK